MIDISQKVLKQIKDEGLKPKPKWIFWLSSLLMAIGFGALIFVIGFLLNLVLFKIQYSAVIDCQCLDNAIMQCATNDFPVWILVLAVLGMTLGLWLFKKFEFAYRHPWWVYMIGEIVLVVIIALILNVSGVNYYSQPVLSDFYCQATGYGCCEDKNDSTCEIKRQAEEQQMKDVTKKCAGKCAEQCFNK